MNRVFALVFLMAGISLIGKAAERPERFVAIGGGNLIPQVLVQYVKWAGGPQARILVVTWASRSERDETEDYYREKFKPFQVQSIDFAPTKRDMEAQKMQFLKQLTQSTAIFFWGGWQTEIMKVIERLQLRSAILEFYRSGRVIGGTSAGAAIFSKTMLTGEGNPLVISPKAMETVEGLGLLESAVIDQHFIAERRMNRLLSVLLTSGENLGIGIDERTALAVEGGRQVEIFGEGKVAIIQTESQTDERFSVDLLSTGETYDLISRTRRRN